MSQLPSLPRGSAQEPWPSCRLRRGWGEERDGWHSCSPGTLHSEGPETAAARQWGGQERQPPGVWGAGWRGHWGVLQCWGLRPARSGRPPAPVASAPGCPCVLCSESAPRGLRESPVQASWEMWAPESQPGLVPKDRWLWTGSSQMPCPSGAPSCSWVLARGPGRGLKPHSWPQVGRGHTRSGRSGGRRRPGIPGQPGGKARQGVV